MRKKRLERENERLKKRLNVASKMTYESISGESELRYQDVLIKGGYHDFMDNFSRKEVVLNDAIGERITLGFLRHIFQKLPKFCPDDEIQPTYIMEDVRDAIDTLNLKPKFISIGVNAVTNGWSLVKWLISETGLACKIFGYEECHPRYWIRFQNPKMVNMISHYRAIYIPRPAGMEALYHILNEERYILYPQDPTLQHLTRVDYNYGFGYSRIQPIWDAITKLRERSDSDHFLKSNFMEARYPQAWTSGNKAKKFIDKVRKTTKRRGIAIEAVTNPQTNEDTGLPSVQYRPWGQGPQGQPMDINRASAYLDGEWLRLLVNLGYSQAWATGAAAGALEGSEINLTRDDRADIAEFAVLEPIYKEILKRLAELGVMTTIGVSQESVNLLLSKKYRMVSWLTWEYNDKAALQQEQLDHQMEMQRSESDDRNAYDKENEGNGVHRHNSRVEAMLLLCMRENRAMPMTPVMSSWIKRIGYDEGSLYMEVHDETSKGITTYEYNNPQNPEGYYQEWVDSGSKGGYWWDRIRDILSPAFKHGKPPSYLETGYGEGMPFTEPQATREFKMEGEPSKGIKGAGTTREPLRFIEPVKKPQEPRIIESPGYPTEFETPVYNPTMQKEKPWMKYNPRSPYPVTYNEKFKKTLNSKSALMRFAAGLSTDHLPTGWSMRSDTPYKIRELVEALGRASTRLNRVSFGNSIKAGHPYNYGGEDEFICPREYKKNIGKKVPLGIYHNLENQGTVDLPEWQIIGTHEVLGWDEELGQEIAKNEYDENKINEFFKRIGEENWIQPYFDRGEEPPISGAYTCTVEKHNDRNFQMNIDLKSMSFVKDANCPWHICNFKPQPEEVKA